jgi:hypothetical protein
VLLYKYEGGKANPEKELIAKCWGQNVHAQYNTGVMYIAVWKEEYHHYFTSLVNM